MATETTLHVSIALRWLPAVKSKFLDDKDNLACHSQEFAGYSRIIAVCLP